MFQVGGNSGVARIVGGTNGLFKKHQEGSMASEGDEDGWENEEGTVELSGSAGRITSLSHLWGEQEREARGGFGSEWDGG